MRYLGRYHQSYAFRKIKREVEETDSGDDTERFEQRVGEKFQESVQNYFVIFILVLSLTPLIYFLGEFRAVLNYYMTLYVFGLIILAVTIIKPYKEMRKFNDNSSASIALKFKSHIRGPGALIGLKVMGFMFLLAIMNYAYQDLQKNPFFLSQDELTKRVKASGLSPILIQHGPTNHTSFQIEFIGLNVASRFIEARETASYEDKRNFITSQDSTSIQISSTSPAALLWALRFAESDWKQFEDDREDFGRIPVLASVEDILSNHKKPDSDWKRYESLVIFILGGFITILVGLVLSTFILNGNASFNAKGILSGVVLQSIIVGFIGWYFFKTFDVDYTSSPLTFDYWTAIKYQGEIISIGITYVVLSLGLLLVVSFDRFLRLGSEVN